MTGAARTREATRWLNAQVRTTRGALAGAVVGGSVNGVLLIAQAFVLARLIAHTVFAHESVATQSGSFLLLLGIFALRAATAYARARFADHAALTVQARTRDRLIAHIHALGPVWTNARTPGELANTALEGVDALHAYYADYLPQALLAVIVPVLIVAAVFPVDWISGLVFAGTACLIPLFMVLLGKGAAAVNARQWRRMARLSAHFFEVLSGLPVLNSFGAGRSEARIVEKLSEDYRHSTMRVLRVAFLSAFALEFLSMLGIAMVAVLIGFRLLWGDIGFPAGLAVLFLAPEFYLPLRKLGDAYHARLSAVAAAEDIAEILATPVPSAAGHAAFAPEGAFGVAFEHVTYSYPGTSRPALSDVSLDVAAGQHLALIGPTGAGKSTLMNLLLGFARATSGRIRVGGQSLDDLSLDAWRRQIAWVPQRAHLFAGTVADNIALGLGHASRSAILAAAERAHARAFIEALPKGFDTPIGEGGAGLSGGEIQRIALARAFLRDTPLVVLDEPTASLDAASEAAVIAAIDALARGRTVISIAHRLHTLRAADRIVVLEAGRIVADTARAPGTRPDPRYRQLLATIRPQAEPA